MFGWLCRYASVAANRGFTGLSPDPYATCLVMSSGKNARLSASWLEVLGRAPWNVWCIIHGPNSWLAEVPVILHWAFSRTAGLVNNDLGTPQAALHYWKLRLGTWQISAIQFFACFLSMLVPEFVYCPHAHHSWSKDLGSNQNQQPRFRLFIVSLPPFFS